MFSSVQQRDCRNIYHYSWKLNSQVLVEFEVLTVVAMNSFIVSNIKERSYVPLSFWEILQKLSNLWLLNKGSSSMDIANNNNNNKNTINYIHLLILAQEPD